MDQSDDQTISKSERKRRHHAVRDLGAALSELTPGDLDRVPLDDDLRAAVEEAARLRKGAKQRHLRYLANLLAATDWQPLLAALESIKGQGAAATATQHRLEKWRERLLTEGDGALGELLREYPFAQRGQLRALIRKARADRDAQRPPRSARLLFRLLRDLESERLAVDGERAEASGARHEPVSPDNALADTDGSTNDGNTGNTGVER